MINFARGTINRMEVVGELVALKLEQKLTKTGKQMIMGNVDVEVVKDNNVNVIELKVLAMAGNKMYTSLQTVMNEYKTRQIDGVGDKVRIQGSVELNEYMGGDGILKSFNICNGRFFHRLSEAEHANLGGDKAILTLGGTYMSNKEVLDNEGLPTGEYEVDIFGRTYNSTSKENDKINCLKGLKMSGELFEIFENEFTVGENVTLNIEINRGIVVREETTEKKGFGVQPKVVNNSYRWDYQIVGGTSQGMAEEEDLEQLKMLRKQQLADVSGDGTMDNGKGFGVKPQQNVGQTFGAMDEDLPF